MPELPEVETTKQGILPHVQHQIIDTVDVLNSRFRIPVPGNLHELCKDKIILNVTRRAKYLLVHLNDGYLLIHLGMSGHLRIVLSTAPLQKHDHISLNFKNNTSLRFSDPRRFGLFLYFDKTPLNHVLFASLGPEPLSKNFNSQYLFDKIRLKNKAIKALIMDNAIVVGVGNIYATESLFFAKIHPNTPGNKISLAECKTLVRHIKKILKQAIVAGGTTLKNFYAYDGKPGYFSLSLKIYGKKGLNCSKCNSRIDAQIIAGRNSTFCPNCQMLRTF